MRDKPDFCRACPMYKIGQGYTPPEGARDALVRVIAEAPGAEEEQEARPLVGPTGVMTRRGLKIAGAPREVCPKCGGKRGDEFCGVCRGVGSVFPRVYLGNTVCCRPPKNDYSLVPEGAVEYCLSKHAPEDDAQATTFLMGGKSLQAHFPALNGIERWRGSVLYRAEDRQRFIPVLHPSYIMRGMWHLYPLLARDFTEGIKRHPLVQPTIQHFLTVAGRFLALDIETNCYGSIDLVGMTTDGEHVCQLEQGRYEYLQAHLDAAEIIFAHNAKFDMRKLEAAGLKIDYTKVRDTMIIQAFSQPDLEVGLGAAASITLSGQQTWWKGLWRQDASKERAATRELWMEIHPPARRFTDYQWYRFYNALDVAMTWRLGMKLKRELEQERIAA